MSAAGATSSPLPPTTMWLCSTPSHSHAHTRSVQVLRWPESVAVHICEQGAIQDKLLSVVYVGVPGQHRGSPHIDARPQVGGVGLCVPRAIGGRFVTRTATKPEAAETAPRTKSSDMGPVGGGGVQEGEAGLLSCAHARCRRVRLWLHTQPRTPS